MIDYQTRRGRNGETVCWLCGKLSAQTPLYATPIVAIADGRQRWACDFHRDRAPCIIDGCRRTFRGHPRSEFICGRHWRLAPRPMRDVYSRIRRLARRYGWTEALRARFDRIWSRIVRAVNKPSLEMIERMLERG